MDPEGSGVDEARAAQLGIFGFVLLHVSVCFCLFFCYVFVFVFVAVVIVYCFCFCCFSSVLGEIFFQAWGLFARGEGVRLRASWGVHGGLEC